MLTELKGISQKNEKYHRRWFEDDYFELIVWQDTAGGIYGFQLCYERFGDERTLTWKTDTGFDHERIDDSRSMGSMPATAILVPDGVFPAGMIIEKFTAHAREIDPGIASFVIGKMGVYGDIDLSIKFVQPPGGAGEFNGITGIRVGVVPRAANRIDYKDAPAEIRFKEKLLLKEFTGLDEKRIVMLNQVHGDGIIVLDTYPEENLPWAADADGMITTLSNLCLVIRTADCVPVFVVDENRRVQGAAHSGWKGCRADISGKLVGMMKEKFRCNPKDISAYILPSIGPESYRVNEDVARFFPDDSARRGDGIYLNLWKNVESSLVREGVSAARIYTAARCTLRDEHYFSHRRGDAGRNLNFAVLFGD
jgi:hypothetical protein